MSVLAGDNFTRANENPMAGWTTLTGAGGGVKVVSNEMQAITTGEIASYYTGVTPPNDQYSKLTIRTLGSGSGPGPAVRLQTGSLGGYQVSAYGASSGGLIMTRDDATAIGTSLGSEPHVSGDVYQINAVGASIEAFRNGVSKISGTDSTYASGRFGIWWWENAIGSTADDWEGGDFSAGGGSAPRMLPLLGAGAIRLVAAARLTQPMERRTIFKVIAALLHPFKTLLLALACIGAMADSAEAAGRAFYDGFETYTTNAQVGSPWVDDGNGLGSCQVRTASFDGLAGAAVGSKFLSCNWDGSGSDDTGTGSTWQSDSLTGQWTYTSDLLFRFRLRVDTDKDCTGCDGGPKILRIGNTINTPCSFAGMHDGGGGLTGDFCNDSGGYVLPTLWGGNSAGDNAWHEIAIYIHVAGGSSGIVRYFIDHTEILTATGDTATDWGFTKFYLASNWSGGTGCCLHDANNHIYWDEFEIFTDNATGGTGLMSNDTIVAGGGGGGSVGGSTPSGTRGMSPRIHLRRGN